MKVNSLTNIVKVLVKIKQISTDLLIQIALDKDYGHPMKAQIKEIWNFGPMRQTKYASAEHKNLGFGIWFLAIF